MFDFDFQSGFIEEKSSGVYRGRVTIDGVLLSSISGVYFLDGGVQYLWLRRDKVLEYDYMSGSFNERNARPHWEVYMKKCYDDGVIGYRGEFTFMRFCYSIVGVWDRVLGLDKHRLNLYVERLSSSGQRIINAISKNNSVNNK